VQLVRRTSAVRFELSIRKNPYRRLNKGVPYTEYISTLYQESVISFRGVIAAVQNSVYWSINHGNETGST
jgi:hypothetical protein